MSLPLLEYAPSSQNQRVQGFEIPGDEQPRLYDLLLSSDVESIITAAYRQIFHEQQMLTSNRQEVLESQLKSGQITVKGFIRGLVLSDSFRRLNYEVNNNYRFVEICVQRVLGRSVYSNQEKIAWSIVLATQGVMGFIDQLLDSEEYNNHFGDHIVPYQQRRILPQREQGELPFERMARYGTDYRDQLPSPSGVSGLPSQGADGLFRGFEPFSWQQFLQRANWSVVTGLGTLLLILVAVMLAITAISY